MKLLNSSLAAILLLATSASCHTIFQKLHVNGVDQGQTVGIRVPNYNGPIENVDSNDIICNGGINPYRQPVSKTVIQAPSGAEITAEWHHDLNGATGSSSDPVDPSHKGPMLAYLARIPDATQEDVTGLKWFKIYHDGLDTATGEWGVDKLIKNKGKLTFKLPTCIPAGQYLLRVEMIALHGASNYPGAQFYMECAQLNIVGGGNASPATVSFPGAYKGTDPGVRINIYQGLSGYTIPGPSVFTCGASEGPGTPTTPAPEPTPTTTTSTPPTTSAPTGPTVPQWGV
ncbi:hypothetical protein EST38_g4240 [Candolleomyces aberdarensis]|uniref:AA9 family lytic polysaccharide monooxygenase n=1 Tax=Candolleomyces aberdarensis TaxID=2316362 RepID=A0A4Q2DQ68_9AGAR|nr:hypothetical protein EST38_g4240 [Candolleomyces aberdarensis]